MADATYYEDLLRSTFEGRKVILCADTLVVAAAHAKSLTRLGAVSPMLIAGSRGTGDVPVEDEAAAIVLGTSGETMMGGIRAFEEGLLDPPIGARQAIEGYDPGREAIVIGTSFTRSGTRAGHMWDRELIGGRPDSWMRLEDKLIVDDLLDAADIERAPSENVPADAGALSAAAARLDRGHGSAWAGDTKEGWWGGGEYLRWVRTGEDAAQAIAFFEAHCDRVRVMPFLEGIPCSIHGLVFTDDVIAFRPVEMLTLRRPGSNALHYAGLATYWDPPDADRDQMRSAARALGAHLRERVDYLGAFTLDGVMSADGFLPTEVNARAGAGFSPHSAAAGVGLALLSQLICRDPTLDYRPRDLQTLVVERADVQRSGSCYTVFRGEAPSETREVVDRDGKLSFRSTDEQPFGTFHIGSSAVGGFIRYQPDADSTPRGRSFAPTAVRAFAFADEHLGTNLGPREAAREVRA